MTVAAMPSPKLNLPQTAALVFENSLQVFTECDGFEDRIDYANQLVQECNNLRFLGLCSPEHYAAMLRRVRSELQGDLGAIVTPEPRTIFDVAVERDLRGDL